MKYAVIFLILFSCSHNKNKTDVESVLLDTTAPTIEIQKNSTSEYGPSVELDEDQQNSVLKSSDIIALSIYPTLYETLALIPYLKEIEKNKINISIISSTGFGSVIAALYAKKKSVSYLEWKMFDLQKRVEGKIIYSDEWQNIINNFIKEEFKEMRVSQLKTLLMVPEYKNGILRFDQNGAVSDVIKRSINLKDKDNYILNMRSIEDSLKENSADRIVNTVFLPKNPKIRKLDDYRLGVITTFLGKVIADIDKNDLLRIDGQINIDEMRSITKIEEDYSQIININIENLKQKYNKWMEESTHNSNSASE